VPEYGDAVRLLSTGPGKPSFFPYVWRDGVGADGERDRLVLREFPDLGGPNPRTTLDTDAPRMRFRAVTPAMWLNGTQLFVARRDADLCVDVRGDRNRVHAAPCPDVFTEWTTVPDAQDTDAPTAEPTSSAPSASPVEQTLQPSTAPSSSVPSRAPSHGPSRRPTTLAPTPFPTPLPTRSPTATPPNAGLVVGVIVLVILGLVFLFCCCLFQRSHKEEMGSYYCPWPSFLRLGGGEKPAAAAAAADEGAADRAASALESQIREEPKPPPAPRPEEEEEEADELALPPTRIESVRLQGKEYIVLPKSMMASGGPNGTLMMDQEAFLQAAAQTATASAMKEADRERRHSTTGRIRFDPKSPTRQKHGGRRL